VLDKTMTEADLQKLIIQAAQLYGWRVSHFRPALTAKGWRTAVEGHAGFPDLVLARAGVVIVAELKTERGKLTAAQAVWREALGDCYRLWRPHDIGAILSELRGRSVGLKAVSRGDRPSA
jgi:hypothetical protein